MCDIARYITSVGDMLHHAVLMNDHAQKWTMVLMPIYHQELREKLVGVSCLLFLQSKAMLIMAD